MEPNFERVLQSPSHALFFHSFNLCDGSSQNPGIIQSRIRGRLTPWDRHLNNGRRSKISSITPVHLGAVTEHLLPFTAVERTAHQ